MTEQALPTNRTDASRRSVVWLGIGAAAGLLLATLGLLESGAGGDAAIPEDAVAVVNGEVIRRDDYLRVLAGFESDRREPLDDDDRRHVLDRMIEEELLVQRGLELGLAQMDRRVRADLTGALIQSIVSTAEEEEPSEAMLRDFHAQESEFFTRPGRLRVRQIFFRVPPREDAAGATARAERALARIASGEDFAAVAADAGDPVTAPIPDALLPATKLREYVGPTALAAALALSPGEVSAPVRSGIGVHLLQLVDATPAVTPPFEEVATQVEIEWRRRAGDRALRAYLDELREEGDVVVRLPESG